MRQIPISTDVYAALWAARQPGEDDEEAILRRILKIKPPEGRGVPESEGGIGFRDPRFGIELPKGFEVFRIYKGIEYRAKAEGGQWVLQHNGRTYPSFNQLSRAIGTKVENAWNNWYFRKPDGERRLVAELRR